MKIENEKENSNCGGKELYAARTKPGLEAFVTVRVLGMMGWMVR
jgi:hypothetical protein